MALHQKYNNEDILTRSIIAGLLNILNNKIDYTQIWANDVIEHVQIPFYYNLSGDERFQQDFYTHYADCVPPKPVDGNFDMIPRGILTYTGSVVDATRTTSRYIQGSYLKEVNGQLQTYRSFLYSIPLNVNFHCELFFDTQITSLKVEQLIREVFYKTITFYVYYKGMRCGCTVGFPEDYALEKNIQYSFELNNPIKITFDLQVEAYQPVFDPTTEVNANDYMAGLGYRIVDKSMPKNDGNITITTPVNATNDLILPKGYPLLLEWDYINENAIINRVDILWSPAGENTRNIVERLVPNHEYYIWNIPETFTNYKHPAFMWPIDGSISIYRQPLVRILPDLITKEISDTSFIIVDSGYFISPSPDASANIVLEMRDVNNRVVYTGDTSIYFTLKGNKLDSFHVPNGDVVFPGNIDYKEIDIYVTNSVTGYNEALVQTTQPEAFGVIRNVTIV